jgi:hypothetical protein
MLTDEEMHARMANGWRAGQPFTVCGNGSLPDATVSIRGWLPDVCVRREIRTICDAGAGDLKWRDGMTWNIDYRPFDLIPRHPSVTRADITRDLLPLCDAILCRMVLNHLDEERVSLALDLFSQSARFLIATQFNGEDLPQRSPQFTRLDLRLWLGDPIESVPDGRESSCSLALWAI